MNRLFIYFQLGKYQPKKTGGQNVIQVNADVANKLKQFLAGN